MRKNITVFLCTVVLAAGIYAQNAERKWSLGAQLGKTEYIGDLGNALFKPGEDFYSFAGLSVNRYLCRSFDLGFMGIFGKYGYEKNSLEKFSEKKYDGSLLLSYKLNNGYLIKENCNFSPSLIAGGGLVFYDASNVTKEDNFDFVIPMGIGLKYTFNKWAPWLSVQYLCLFNLTFDDNRDNVIEGKNDHYINHSIGLWVNMGEPSDADNDGVKDKLDKCPGTPSGVKVDANGCPLDSDNDGIADYLDKCPKQKGLMQFEGCPDTDGDGIQDGEDKCPTVAGLAAFKGCPDTDGDGIQDSEDDCPKLAGLAAFKGCPDTDGDGIQDSQDKCPKVAGLAALKGCPDRDGDGIADEEDLCPDKPGIKANKGCPEVKKETLEIFKQALTGIKFETGKDVITTASYPILDKVVQVMKDNPEYKLAINGHTDDVGDDDKNIVLSQNRANAVKKYLADKGVAAERMTATGYGETKPVGDNKTPAGRAENRRVEFVVNF